MNCISWNVGHLAWQEQRYWLYRAQGQLRVRTSTNPSPTARPRACLRSTSVDGLARDHGASDSWLDAVTTETATVRRHR
jgi:hypothetical protein